MAENTDRDNLPQATVVPKKAPADLDRLDHPDPRRGGGHRDCDPAHHERRPDHHHRLQGCRRSRGRQDLHQVQGREHRPGDGGASFPTIIPR